MKEYNYAELTRGERSHFLKLARDKLANVKLVVEELSLEGQLEQVRKEEESKPRGGRRRKPEETQ